MSMSSIDSSSSYSSSSNVNSQYKPPTLLSGNGIEYGTYRAAMITYLMRIGLKDTDYVLPIKEWDKINEALKDYELKETEAAINFCIVSKTSKSTSSLTPTTTTVLNTEEKEMFKKVREVVKRANVAYTVLFSSLPEDIRLLVQPPAVVVGYGHGIWDLLEKKFRNTEQDSVGALWQQFTSLQQAESESFADYRARVDAVITLLTHAKQSVPNGLKCTILIDRLQPQYTTMVLVLKSTEKVKDVDKIEWNDIATFISGQERNMDQTSMIGSQSEHRAMATFNNQLSNNNSTFIDYKQQTCQACGMKGHTQNYPGCKKHALYDPNHIPFKSKKNQKKYAANKEQARSANTNKKSKKVQESECDDSDTDDSFHYCSYSAVVQRTHYALAGTPAALSTAARRAAAPTTLAGLEAAANAAAKASAARKAAASSPSTTTTTTSSTQPVRKVRRIDDRKDDSELAPIPVITADNQWTLVQSRKKRKQDQLNDLLAGNAWGVDSMASVSLSGNRALFTGLHRCSPIAIETADGAVIQASLVGTIELRLKPINKPNPILIKVHNVYLNERVTANLLSLQRMVSKENGWKFKATSEGSQVETKGGHTINCSTAGHVTILEHAGEERVLAAPLVQTPITIRTAEEILLLHQKLGHMSFNKLKAICEQQTTRDIGVMKLTSHETKSAQTMIAECAACRAAKDKKSKFGKHGLDVGTAPFEQIHADLFYVIRHDKHGKKITEYGVAMKDPHSQCRMELCVPTKDLVASEVIGMLEFIATQSGVKLKKFHTDGGTEFKPLLTKVDSYCRQHGIQFTNSPKDTQQLNGIAERAVGETKTRTNSLLKHAHLPDKYWGYACAHEVYLWNRTYISKHTGVTPYEAMYKKKPHLDNISVFGCDVEVHVGKKERESTFDSHITRGIYLGHEPLKHSPRILLLPSCKITITRNVHYLETKFNNFIAFKKNKMNELGAFESNGLTPTAGLAESDLIEDDELTTTSESKHNMHSSTNQSQSSSHSNIHSKHDSDDDDEDEIDETEYTIDKIVGSRDGVEEKEYEVAWKGYPSSDNTWLPFSELTRARGLIREYNRDNARAYLTLVRTDTEHVESEQIESQGTLEL